MPFHTRGHTSFSFPGNILFFQSSSNVSKLRSFTYSIRVLTEARSLKPEMSGSWVWMRGTVPWPGIEPGPPVLGARSVNHCTTREVPVFLLLTPPKSQPVRLENGKASFTPIYNLSYFLTATLFFVLKHLAFCSNFHNCSLIFSWRGPSKSLWNLPATKIKF